MSNTFPKEIKGKTMQRKQAFECPECGDLHLADYHRAPDKPQCGHPKRQAEELSNPDNKGDGQ